MANRKLTLRTEHLTELTPAELGGVVGGSPNTKTCPDYTYHCPTGDAMCRNLTYTCICV